MTGGTRVRDWATVDFYALLGVEPNADAEAVTRAFRELAKRSHPDATDDEAAAARFSDVTAAYAVLGDRATRREYDRVRAETRAPAPVAVPGASRPAAAPPTTNGPKLWSPRRALTVMAAGVLVTVLGLGAVVLTWSMHTHDARQRARFVPVTATRLPASGYVSFVTRSGARIRVPEPTRHGDPTGNSSTVRVRYDPADPEHVIVDSTSAARDITFAIVSLKLLIGGAFFAGLGAFRWRAARARA
jgi:hypothetical protein